MWRARNKRTLPASAFNIKYTPSEKRARKEAEEQRRNETPEQTAAILSEEINDLETEIKKNASKFEAVRMEMLTGIISHDGVSAKQITDQLMQQLDKLQKEHADALAKVDRAAIERMRTNSMDIDSTMIINQKLIGKDNRCKGGCKACDIRIDSVLCMDVCTKCHTTYDRRLDNQTANISYSDYHPGERVARIGGYKPPNHLTEIVYQFQGKRRSAAPQEIVDKIKRMCDRYKIEKCKITPDICRLFLKQLQQEQAAIRKFNHKTAPSKFKKYTDYYKHCPEISYRLSGIPPPYMTPMQENRVFALFPMVVAGYKTSPRYLTRKKDKKNRKTREEPNNMNYLYTFYKECEMLGYEEFLPYIPLPKSLANIDDNDQNGWKHCCDLYGWSFCPTR